MATLLETDIAHLSENIAQQYAIPAQYFEDQSIKRGLRNADGTGVLIGVSKVGSVQGYYMMDGERVPMPGKLYYRGISVEDIVAAHRRNGTFGYEEVAYLLLLGSLPTQAQQQRFNDVMARARSMPSGFTEDMILKAPSRNIMNQLARSVLALYSYDDRADDTALDNVLRQSIGLIARFPLIAANAFAAKRHYFDGESLILHNPEPELSVAENILRMIRPDAAYTPEEAHLLDLMLILHAEHSSNNSTFVCRAITSSGTDTYSAIAGAVGSLKGPLHGGANAKVMQMFRDIREHVGTAPDDTALDAYLDRILDGEAGDRSGKIYGLGHAVYTMSDPRAVVIKKYAASLASAKGRLPDLELMERVEARGIEKIMTRKRQTIPMCANVDLYSGLIYSMLDIPEDLYTPLFATARIAGWCAHRLEELATGNRIMRPAYRAMLIKEPYIPVDARTIKQIESPAPVQSRAFIFYYFLLRIRTVHQDDLHIGRNAAVVDGQRDGLAGSELVLDAVELLHRRDGDAVDGGDDIALADALGGSVTVAVNARHINALRQTVIDAVRRGERLAVDADGRAAGDIALFDQFVDDGLGCIDGDGKADTLDGRGQGIEVAHLHCIDADDLSVAVDERPAGVAVIECGIRLNQAHGAVVDGQITVDRGDDAVCHGPAQRSAERVADSGNAVSDLQNGRIAELSCLKPFRFNLQNGKVACLVAADD